MMGDARRNRRSPGTMDWNSRAEEEIREVVRSGAWDDLPIKGQKLDLSGSAKPRS